MPLPLTLTKHYSIAPALNLPDLVEVARLGYLTVIRFEADGERDDMPTTLEAARVARDYGLDFISIPAAPHDLMSQAVVAATSAALSRARGPVLGTCYSGQRAAIVWAAAMVRAQPVDEVLQILRTSGLSLEFLRDEFDAIARRDAPKSRPRLDRAA